MYPCAQEKKNTTCMNDEQATWFVHCTMAELQRIKAGVTSEVPDDKLPFLSKIVKIRIEAMKLPITFTHEALVAVNCLCDRPGSAVILLVDCLNAYKDKEVGMAELAELYPWGFYREDVMMDIVDNYMKPRKHPWSEIY